ncbi:MAG: DUF1211 domain-containing protein [Bdellovibrionales bacterium]|nr:DUF1211 domain-containing protein [Bdellovibrionales bacterium]
MTKNRLEAFSDGVLAIILTIMVLEMKVPHGKATFADLEPIVPIFLSYVLSFAYIGIYWNNHHHMMHVTKKISGSVLWANLHLLFWLSLVPFATGWMGENNFLPAPTALYGVVLFMAGVAYLILQRTIVHLEGNESDLAKAVGRDIKGKFSALLYLVAIPISYLLPWIACLIYVVVALMWIVPDRRIERVATP